ncbi:hypothetical protein [Sphingomonas sp. NFX23]
MQHPHHRFWAAAADKRYPASPTGPMKGCASQTCWTAAFLDATRGR